jgi:hypothetical protein
MLNVECTFSVQLDCKQVVFSVVGLPKCTDRLFDPPNGSRS